MAINFYAIKIAVYSKKIKVVESLAIIVFNSLQTKLNVATADKGKQTS